MERESSSLSWGPYMGSILTANHAWRVFRKEGAAITKIVSWQPVSVVLTFLAALVGQVSFRTAATGDALELLGGLRGFNGLAGAVHPVHSWHAYRCFWLFPWSGCVPIHRKFWVSQKPCGRISLREAVGSVAAELGVGRVHRHPASGRSPVPDGREHVSLLPILRQFLWVLGGLPNIAIPNRCGSSQLYRSIIFRESSKMRTPCPAAPIHLDVRAVQG